MRKPLFLFIFISIQHFAFAQVNKDSIRMLHTIQRDTTYLQNILHDSLTFVHSNGLIESKKDFLQSIITQSIVYQKAIFSNYSSLYTSNLNINMGEVDIEGFYKEQAFAVKLRFTSIYKKVKNKWKLYYWQSTKLGK